MSFFNESISVWALLYSRPLPTLCVWYYISHSQLEACILLPNNSCIHAQSLSANRFSTYRQYRLYVLISYN